MAGANSHNAKTLCEFISVETPPPVDIIVPRMSKKDKEQRITILITPFNHLSQDLR